MNFVKLSGCLSNGHVPAPTFVNSDKAVVVCANCGYSQYFKLLKEPIDDCTYSYLGDSENNLDNDWRKEWKINC